MRWLGWVALTPVPYLMVLTFPTVGGCGRRVSGGFGRGGKRGIVRRENYSDFVFVKETKARVEPENRYQSTIGFENYGLSFFEVRICGPGLLACGISGSSNESS